MGFFTLEQARQLLPIVKKITEKYRLRVDNVMEKLERVEITDFVLIDLLEAQVNEYLTEWNKKITRLGGIPEGLWRVGFDCGDGMYCWKYPESDIFFWHAYTESDHGRVLVSDKFDVDDIFLPTNSITELS